MIVKGNYLYMTAKDLADLRGLNPGEWEPYNPRKHKKEEYIHVFPTKEDFEKLFPEFVGPYSIY